MLRRSVLLLLALVASHATPAEAGLHAVYADRFEAEDIWVADNGDTVESLGPRKRLVIRGGEAFVVEERLTGPVVFRLADLEAIVRTRRAASPAPRTAMPDFVSLGRRTFNGREAEAFGFPTQPATSAEGDSILISHDPGLEPLRPAVAAYVRAEEILLELENPIPADLAAMAEPTAKVLEKGTLLRLGDMALQSVERRDPPAERFLLPTQPETAEALRARLDREALEAKAEQEGRGDLTMISRAVFAEGRLWLLTDTGKLSSIADGGDSLSPEDPGGDVLDVCTEGGRLLALVGKRGDRKWSLRRHGPAGWEAIASPAGGQARFLALDCSGAAPIIVSDKALTDLSDPSAPRTLPLSGLGKAQGRIAAIQVEPDAVYVGLNAGEWGGGLRRIDRRTGRSETIERNATGELCDGPLNTACDPVNGIAPLPWKPGCIAIAVGLLHMDSHGRIASVCGSAIEQIYAKGRDRALTDAAHAAEVAKGGFGSVAFFGLAATGDRLLAVGHDGLYRLGPDGRADYRDWPLFKKVGGVLVSFALPDVILVVTEVNARVSVGGGAPMLVVR
jgi:hypothetical protein